MSGEDLQTLYAPQVHSDSPSPHQHSSCALQTEAEVPEIVLKISVRRGLKLQAENDNSIINHFLLLYKRYTEAIRSE